MVRREDLHQQLLQMIFALELEGILDYHFSLVYMMKERYGPFYFVDLIAGFCSQLETTFKFLSESLDRPDVECHCLQQYSIRLQETASCFGARRLAVACGDLCRAINDNSEVWIVLALNGIKVEYSILLQKLDMILELERRIIFHDT